MAVKHQNLRVDVLDRVAKAQTHAAGLCSHQVNANWTAQEDMADLRVRSAIVNYDTAEGLKLLLDSAVLPN